jgi:integrase
MKPNQEHPGITPRVDRDGRTRYQVRVRRNGRIQIATVGSLEEALSWRAAALAAAEGRGEAPQAPRPTPAAPEPAGRAVTVTDAAKRLSRGMKDGTIRSRDGKPYKASVVRKYEENLRTLVIPRIGAVPVTTLTSGDCQRLVDQIAAERTAEHARKALTALRVALRVCQRYGELDANPCAGVRVPVSGDGEKQATILTPEQAAAIITAAEDEDQNLKRSFAAPLVALGFGSGLRLGELLALQYGPEGLDLDAGIAHVTRALDRVRAADGSYSILAPKSRASRRQVPLAAEEVARLRRHRLATGRPLDGELVFHGPDRQALSPVPAYRAWKRACRVALGKPKAKASELPRLHDTRHAYATSLLAAGLGSHAVAALLGHADASLVDRRYGHALPDELATAGDRLSEWRSARAAKA